VELNPSRAKLVDDMGTTRSVHLPGGQIMMVFVWTIETFREFRQQNHLIKCA